MRKSDEMLQELDCLKTEVRNLMDANEVKKAYEKTEELKNLKAKIEIQRELEAEEMNVASDVVEVQKTMVDVNKLFNKALLGRPMTQEEKEAYNSDEYLNNVGTPGQAEHTDSKGGFLVPVEQYNQILEYKRNLVALSSYCNHYPVSSRTGTMPAEVTANEKLTNFEELNEIGQHDIDFKQIKWDVADYGDIIPVSNTLLADETANLMNYIGRRFAKKAVRTENEKIINALKTATKKTPKSLAEFNKTMITGLPTAIMASAKIFTNVNGYAWLDSLFDKNGRPLLQPMPTEPTKMMYKGHELVVIDNEDLPGAETTVPFFVGDMSQFLGYFDRQQMSLAVSTEAGFTKNATLLRAIERFDVQKLDEKAMLFLEVNTKTAKVEAAE